MALVMTAVKYGATVANKVEVVKLHKDAEGKLHGARLKDKLTGDEWDVQAKVRFHHPHSQSIPSLPPQNFLADSLNLCRE